jgi:hypothetical protein
MTTVSVALAEPELRTKAHEGERAASDAWYDALQSVKPVATSATRLGSTFHVPFSFVYGGKASRDLLATWRKSTESQVLPSGRIVATTHLFLRPGESIRTPRMLALFWQGDRMRGNNLLRRLLLAHRRFKPNGRPLILPVLIGSWGGSPATDHMKTIRRIIDRDLPIDPYRIDAEWFGKGLWYFNPGNWEVRKDLYPEGFAALSRPLHRRVRPGLASRGFQHRTTRIQTRQG